MSKIITIQNINIKEFSITYQQDKWNISVVYSLVADDETELNPKRDTIKDSEITAGQKTYLNNILTALINKIKLREGIT